MPLDWHDPTGDTISLALIRKTATGTKLGSLLVNPGGPGSSGIFDMMFLDAPAGMENLNLLIWVDANYPYP